jgi:hypothetical protein
VVGGEHQRPEPALMGEAGQRLASDVGGGGSNLRALAVERLKLVGVITGD